jgi:hypothetical protein
VPQLLENQCGLQPLLMPILQSSQNLAFFDKPPCKDCARCLSKDCLLCNELLFYIFFERLRPANISPIDPKH